MRTPRRQPRSALFRLAERAVGGDMQAYLKRRREEDDATFEQIARDLTEAIDDDTFPVSPTVVWRWAVALGVHERAS